MTTENLTRKQQEFLEECMLEFSHRYTSADLEYKKVYDGGIPEPPIMYPWFGRPKLTAYRHRDRRNDSRDRYPRQGYRDDRYEDASRGHQQSYNRDHRNSDNRFRPY